MLVDGGYFYISLNMYTISRNENKPLLCVKGGFEGSSCDIPFNCAFDNLLILFEVLGLLK